MSLPPAAKDVNSHPASNSVVDPVNKQAQAADVDRKLRFYGVVHAFGESKMPTNKQIDDTLDYVLKHSPVDVHALSSEGQRLIQDSRDIIETAKLIVKEKNADELFQNFIWHTRQVDISAAKKDASEVVPVDKEKVKEDGRQALQHLRTLLTLIATNSEVRKLFADFTIIGRDLLARSTAKVADKIRPDEERLRTVDDSARSDQFITKGGRVVGPNETPILEARIPGMDKTVVVNPKEGTAVKHEDGSIQSASDAKDELADRARKEMRNQRDDILNAVNDDAASDDGQEKKRSFMSKFLGVRDVFADKLPQEQKDKFNENVDRAKNFLKEEYFPEERRDQFIFRGKKVIIECQKHKDYQESIRWLLGFIEEYASHGKTIVNEGVDSHQQLTSDPALQQGLMELRTLLERFANGMQMNIIGSMIRTLYNDAQQDEELKKWFNAVDAYTRKVLLEAGFVLEPECNEEADKLREEGRRFYDEKYKDHFDDLFNCLREWFREMGEDPLNKRFGQDWARLTKNLLFDDEGSLKFKPELWMDIRKVILPSIIDRVGYIPIPRIEYTDESLDLVVENLALSGRNLFPNVVSMETNNYMRFSPYNAIKDEGHHEFILTFGQIQADMRDVAFYFRKKTGAVKLSDSGLADVLLGGEGLTITAHIVSAGKDSSSVFKVKNVHVKVATLKFSIRDSKHDILYKTLKPLATGLVKRQLQKAIADAVTTGLEYVDGQLVGVRDRMKEAKASKDKNRTQVLQEMFKRHKDAAKGSVRGKAEDRQAHFKVVSRRDSAIIQQAGHPSGWANRIQEKKEAAEGGKDWRSDAFAIV